MFADIFFFIFQVLFLKKTRSSLKKTTYIYNIDDIGNLEELPRLCLSMRNVGILK